MCLSLCFFNRSDSRKVANDLQIAIKQHADRMIANCLHKVCYNFAIEIISNINTI